MSVGVIVIYNSYYLLVMTTKTTQIFGRKACLGAHYRANIAVEQCLNSGIYEGELRYYNLPNGRKHPYLMDQPIFINKMTIYKDKKGWYFQIDDKTLQLTNTPDCNLTYGFLTRIKMRQLYDNKNKPIKIVNLTLDDPPEKSKYSNSYYLPKLL